MAGSNNQCCVLPVSVILYDAAEIVKLIQIGQKVSYFVLFCIFVLLLPIHGQKESLKLPNL